MKRLDEQSHRPSRVARSKRGLPLVITKDSRPFIQIIDCLSSNVMIKVDFCSAVFSQVKCRFNITLVKLTSNGLPTSDQNST